MTPKYHINLLWSEADDAWVADVRDLQSCSAFGEMGADAFKSWSTAAVMSLSPL